MPDARYGPLPVDAERLREKPRSDAIQNDCVPTVDPSQLP